MKVLWSVDKSLNFDYCVLQNVVVTFIRLAVDVHGVQVVGLDHVDPHQHAQRLVRGQTLEEAKLWVRSWRGKRQRGFIWGLAEWPFVDFNRTLRIHHVDY